jgi:hypothetical protein
MTANPSLRDRIVGIAGPDIADRIIAVLDEEAVTPCRDADCVRRRRHSRIDRHLWRHEANAPLSRWLFGWRCFTCGRSTWRHIHKPGTAS